MKKNKYSNKRIKYVDKSIRDLSHEAQKLQRSVWDVFVDKVMLNLTAKGRTIVDNDQNQQIINSLGDLIDGEIRDGDGQKFLEWYVKQMEGMGQMSEDYFKSVLKGKDDLIEKFAKENRNKLLSLIGYQRGQVKPGSFLYSIIDFGKPYANLQNGLITSAFTGQPFDLKGAKDYVIGTNAGTVPKPDKGESTQQKNHSGGAIEGAIVEKTFDTFPKADRLLSKNNAAALNLKYAIYQGGIIKTSRDFCIERNNRVFSTEEIEKFGTADDKYGGYTDKSKGEFDGKDEPYNPFTSLGGWNCRHHLDFVSNEMAELLKENEPKPDPESEKTLNFIEDKIRNQNFESAALFKDDKLIFFKDGEKSHVEFDDEEVSKMKGAVLTHNHPSGSSFSTADIMITWKQQIKEIRAVTNKEYNYRIEVPKKSKFYKLSQQEIRDFMKSATDQAYAIIDDKIARKEINREQAEKEFSHEKNKKFAEMVKIIYERIKR